MRFAKAFFIVILFFFSMMFFLQNEEVLSQTMPLQLNVYIAKWRSIPLPFYLLTLIAFTLGALFSLLYFLAEKIRLTAQIKSCRFKMARMEKEINSLRNIPLKGEVFEPKPLAELASTIDTEVTQVEPVDDKEPWKSGE